MTQQQFTANWHDDFVKNIQELLSFIDTLVIFPQATNGDKRAFDQINIMLHSVLSVFNIN